MTEWETVFQKLKLAWRRLFRHPQWNIGVIPAPIHALLDEAGLAAKAQWFPLNNRDGFLADPFGIPRTGGATILCEYYDYKAGKGTICSLEFDGQKFSAPATVIDLPFHLSYPYLIESGGEMFCIPEAHRAREVALYKAERFPDRWIKAGVLLEGIAALDTTVFEHDGRWWLMCTDAEARQDVNLRIWHAPALQGPWIQHARNPAKSDIRSARPGGTPFVHQGQLYRPAQDCSKRYGWRIAINRVTRLTPEEFSEEVAATIDPPARGPFPAGRHTLSSAGDVTLIDGHRFVFVGHAFRAFLKIWWRDISRK